MSIETVLQQMTIIFLLIMIGSLLHRKEMITDTTSRQISGLVVNLCNPALLVYSAFNAGPGITLSGLLEGLLIVLLVYAVLIGSGYLIPYMLRVQREEHSAYRLITIYGNIGFIGIPLSIAVLGEESLIYVSLHQLIFNILIYTHGIATIKRSAGQTDAAAHHCPQGSSIIGNYEGTSYDMKNKTGTKGTALSLLLHTKKFVNAGTLSAILTIILYLSDFRIPSIFPDTLNYIGRSTTFLSMLVLGVSVAQTSPGKIFCHMKLYGFCAVRMVLIPIGCIFLLRLFTDNSLLIHTSALMLSVPCANMPLILSKQYGLDSPVLANGIILSTALSLITIPIVSLFV